MRFATPPPATAALSALVLLAMIAGCGEVKIEKRDEETASAQTSSGQPGEEHLQGIQKLTAGGYNRQVRPIPGRREIVWLHRAAGDLDYRVVRMDTEGDARRHVSPDRGRCHDVDISPDGALVIYSSTYLSAGEAATHRSVDEPHAPAPVAGWPFDAGYDLFLSVRDQEEPIRLTASDGYDAEASFAPQGGQVIFTHMEDGRGRLDLMMIDGGERRTVLEWPAYIGGACFSPDGERIVFQATDPDGAAKVGLYICASDGSDVRKLTGVGGYNLSPAWHPGGEFLIFASDSAGRDYELFVIRPDGTGREQVTHSPGADLYPRFTRDGRQLYWTSQRQAATVAETNIFRAVWIN